MRAHYITFFFLCYTFLINCCNAQSLNPITINETGKLTYTFDNKGNTIPDFGMVGYHHGKNEIPNVPIKLILNPTKGDRYNDIQNAINKLSKLPLNSNGFRGSILLKAGYYEISNTLKINKSGIVLKGEGKTINGTVLKFTATTKKNLIELFGRPITIINNTETPITNNYIPIGSKQITVKSLHTFKVGDHVILKWSPNQKWISLMGMDKINTQCDSTKKNWLPKNYVYLFKRVIKNIKKNTLILDAPIVEPLNSKYGHATLTKYDNKNTLKECGVENFRIESSYISETDEAHGWDAIKMYNIENSWVKNINAYYFAHSAISLNHNSYLITVENCGMFEYKSKTIGGRRYGFNMNGCQLSLIKNCKGTFGRHDFVQGAKTSGPNVFLNCSSKYALNDTGPHHRYSVGTLWDNVTTDASFNIQNRLCSGSGHGWAGGQQILWNCKASKMVIHNPPSDAQNWAIGCISDAPITNEGYFAKAPFGNIWLEGQPIKSIPSLYKVQHDAYLHSLFCFNKNTTLKTVN